MMPSYAQRCCCCAGLIEKTTTEFDEEEHEGWHGFESREKALYQFEEFNTQHVDDPMTLVDFMNNQVRV